MGAERRRKMRPVKMGLSIGHWLCGCAGTAGCVVTDGEKEYVVTNNHVAAMENDAEVGDLILQPGPYDGGNPITDAFGKLAAFIKIKFPGNSKCSVAKIWAGIYNFLAKLFNRKTRLVAITEEYPDNEVDAALVEPTVEISKEVVDVGVPKGAAIPVEGMRVKKSGRTTQLTFGRVVDDDATVIVQYSKGPAKFVHQIIIEAERLPFVQPGDSGSAILDERNYVIGLLFAGTQDGRFGIANRIEKVLEALNVKIATEA